MRHFRLCCAFGAGKLKFGVSLALPGLPLRSHWLPCCLCVHWRSLVFPPVFLGVLCRSLALRGTPRRCLALPGASWRSLAFWVFAVPWCSEALAGGPWCSWRSFGFSGAPKRSEVLLGGPWRSLVFPCRGRPVYIDQLNLLN